jgi:hypothetical protein
MHSHLAVMPGILAVSQFPIVGALMSTSITGSATTDDKTINFGHIRSCVLLDGMSPSAKWSAVPSPRSGRLQPFPIPGNRKTLLNIVKVCYLDPPVFVDVGNVIASYTLAQTATVGGTIAPSGGNNATRGASVGLSNSPTITYIPLPVMLTSGGWPPLCRPSCYYSHPERDARRFSAVLLIHIHQRPEKPRRRSTGHYAR